MRRRSQRMKRRNLFISVVVVILVVGLYFTITFIDNQNLEKFF